MDVGKFFPHPFFVFTDKYLVMRTSNADSFLQNNSQNKTQVYTSTDSLGNIVGVQIRRDGQQTDYRRTNRGAQDIFDQPLGELHDFFHTTAAFSSVYQNKSLLDIGCGGGALVQDLNKHKIKAQGLDLVIPLELSNSKSFIQGDAFSIPIQDQSFYVITSIWSVFKYEPEFRIRDLLIEALRVLKPGGVLFLSSLHQRSKTEYITSLCKKLNASVFIATPSGALQIIKLY
jgi:2-polyprenyl-3-methyl-5-hydroxy-6-metoxy-1,4-benzoquinol methylase